MHDLVVCGVVGGLNRRRFTFFEAQQRTRYLCVVSDRLDGAARRDFQCVGSDVDAVIRCAESTARPGRAEAAVAALASPTNWRLVTTQFSC